jgi:hypothetical protein
LSDVYINNNYYYHRLYSNAKEPTKRKISQRVVLRNSSKYLNAQKLVSSESQRNNNANNNERQLEEAILMVKETNAKIAFLPKKIWLFVLQFSKKKTRTRSDLDKNNNNNNKKKVIII